MAVTAPFGFLTGVIQTGRDVVLHARGSRLYTISTRDATLTVVDQRRWAIVRTYALPAGSAPEDVAVTQFDFDGRIGPQLHVSLDYFASALAHDRGGVVFLPDGNVGATGVRAFDDATGAELTTAATATSGAPVDLLAIAHTPKPVR